MKNVIFVVIVSVFSLTISFGQTDNYQGTLKKMFEVSGTQESFKASIKQMFVMFKQQNTDVPDSLWTEFQNEFLNTSIDDIVTMLSPVYQKYLTQIDLEKIINFYQTPVGKKYAESTPMLMRESMQVGQQWGMKIGHDFQKKLKDKGY